MDELLGANNSIAEYIFVLLIYAGLLVAMRQAAPRVEPEFRRSFIVLYVVWAIGTFVGNYLFYKLGIMSFMPWLNNFIHTFVWIGLCLGFLYAISHNRPVWEQLVLFAIYSFVVKVTENKVLGTWEFSRFFFVEGNLAYIAGWSLADALYPIGSALILRLVARFISGITVPKLSVP
jgi:hypothetical protein